MLRNRLTLLWETSLVSFTPLRNLGNKIYNDVMHAIKAAPYCMKTTRLHACINFLYAFYLYILYSTNHSLKFPGARKVDTTVVSVVDLETSEL